MPDADKIFGQDMKEKPFHEQHCIQSYGFDFVLMLPVSLKRKVTEFSLTERIRLLETAIRWVYRPK